MLLQLHKLMLEFNETVLESSLSILSSNKISFISWKINSLVQYDAEVFYQLVESSREKKKSHRSVVYLLILRLMVIADRSRMYIPFFRVKPLLYTTRTRSCSFGRNTSLSLFHFKSDIGVAFDIVYLWIYLMYKFLQRKSEVFNWD